MQRIFLAIGVMVLAWGCSRQDIRPGGHRTVTVNIEPAKAVPERFGLTGDEPVFIGLSISDADGIVTSVTLKPGSNALEVPTGVPLRFKASLLTHRPESRSVLLASTAAVNMTVPDTEASQDSIGSSSSAANDVTVELAFSPYVPVRMVRVFGLVHHDAETPAAGARISVVDPVSGAAIAAPGLNFLAETDDRGTYRFAFPVKLPGSQDTVRLRIEHESAASERSLALIDSGLPGYTLAPINLADDGDVQPNFLNLEDFDEDGTPNTIEVATGSNPFAVEEPERNPALDNPCVEAAKVAKGTVYFCPDGTSRTGALEVAAPVPVCSAGGQTGCVTNDSFRSAATAGLGARVVRGQVVAGVQGTVVLPTVAQVQTGVAFGAGGTLTGTLAGVKANCTTDGSADCTIPATGSIKAVETTGLAAKVVSTASVAGVTGSVVLPAASSVLTGTSYGPSSSVAGTFSPDFADAANVRTNDTTNGVTGTYVPDFPLPSSVLTTDTTDGVTGTVVLPAAAEVLAGVDFGPGGALIGGFVPTASVTCGGEGEVDCLIDPGSSLRPAETAGLASKVLSGASVAGVVGTVVLPVAAQVQTGVSFGAGGLLTGTLDGVKASCANDGDTDCTVPLSGTIKAADTSGFTEWDIRKKRDAGGNVMTFAGLSGKSKTCRNRVNLSVFNNATAPADPSALVPDFFDTIDDWNNDLVGIPLDYPDWTIPGVSGIHGEDFACGGIYATGLTTSGFTGADGSLAHDPDGNWQDLTPGIVPGGANSTNTNPGCNAADKFCVFRELISGLMVTEVSATSYTWANSINYCHNLGEAGGVITSPIPTLDVGLGTAHSDWRLPTQKELTHLYNAGIRGLNQTAGLVTLFGDVDTGFWSASSVANATTNAWFVHLYYGAGGPNAKTTAHRLVCVR